MDGVLAATANPDAPSQVNVSQPSAALVARAKAKGALNSLFLGLGAISLLVGAVGVANIMLIGVLERRSEIGLRRALGATRGQIRAQFLAEAILLALLGGAAGVGAGVAATAVYAATKTGPSPSRPLRGPAGSAPPSPSAPSPGFCPPSEPPGSPPPKHSGPSDDERGGFKGHVFGCC